MVSLAGVVIICEVPYLPLNKDTVINVQLLMYRLGSRDVICEEEQIRFNCTPK
jgi:hypothetical protein